MRKPSNFERNKIICDLRGVMTAARIAKHVGCSRNAVIGVWNRAGLTVPNGRKGTPKPKDRGLRLNDAALRAVMVDIATRRGIQSTANAYGWHPTTIYKWCKAAGADARW